MRALFVSCTGSLLFATVLLAAPKTAAAQDGGSGNWADKAGAFGIGATTTINAGLFVLDEINPTLGSTGLHARYYISDTFGLHLTFGLGFQSDGGGNDDFVLETGLYASVKLVPFPEGHLSAIFGAEFAFADTGATDGFDVGGTGGLFFEYFPASAISLFISAGLRFVYYNRDASMLGDGDGIVLTIGSSVWGSAGFTIWFS